MKCQTFDMMEKMVSFQAEKLLSELFVNLIGGNL